MERSECERLLGLHGKQRQYVIRESKKVQLLECADLLMV